MPDPPVSYTPELRRFIQKLMEPLDPKIKKQKSWLGQPFDPEKINILVADFTNTGGEVDQRSEDVTSATFNKLDQFMKDDPALSEVAEVKRLSSKSNGIVIREETRAKEIGEALNADMVIWGQNLCIGDSICVFAKAFINHETRTATIAEEGVLHRYQLLRADLPLLIGAKANVLMKFIIGWTYLKDYRHKQFQQALKYLQQAVAEAGTDERQNILIWAGDAALYASQYEIALKWYSEVEIDRIKSGDRAGLAATYNSIGMIYDKKSEWDKALGYYNKSEKIRIEVGDPVGLDATYNNIGATYYNKGEWDKGLEYYRMSEKIRLEMGDRLNLATTYNNIGTIYEKKGKWDDALEYYNKSEKIRLEVGDRFGLAVTYNNLGFIYSNKGKWDRALEYYRKSEKLRLEVGDRYGLAITYNNFGLTYEKKGEWDKALEYHGKSEKICLEINDRTNLALSYNNIGVIYDKKGEWDKALEFYGKSENIRLEIGDRVGLVAPYNNMGMIYDKKDKWDKALEYYGKSEKICIEVGDSTSLATIYNNIGLICAKKNDWDKALEYYGKSEKIRIKVGDKAGLAIAYNNIGRIYARKIEWDKALEYYYRSEKLRLEVGDRDGLAITYVNIAAAYRNKEDFNQALQFGERSLQITLQIGDRVNENRARFGLSQTLSAQKRYQEAVPHLERCVVIDKQINHPNLEKDQQELLMTQLRAYLASGVNYAMLDSFLATQNDLEKANLFQRINDWPKAIAHYHSYLRKSRDSLSILEQANIQNLIGDGYVKQSKGDSALPYLQAALQAFQKVNDQKMMRAVYNNLGSAHKLRRDWSEAMAWLRKSAAHNRAVAGDSASVLGFTYYHLAEVFLHTQQPDSGWYYVEKSLLLRQALGEAENVKQTRELREKILSTPRSGKK